MSHLSATQNFRRAARRCLAVGLILAALSLGISFALEGAKAAGMAWGGGAGLLLSLVTGAILYIPWDRYPQLAGSGAMIDFALKVLVMIGSLIVLKNLGDAANPRYFVLSLGVTLVILTLTEVVSLATGNRVYVETKGSKEGPKS